MNSDLAAALQQLPLLRQLDLSNSSFDDTGLAPVSSLSHLQDLRIESLGRSSVASYAALPTGLTRLDLRHMNELVIAGSHAGGLAELSQLRHLQLHEAGAVALTALGGMTQLTHLHLQGLERTASQPMQRLLVVLAGMCQLRHLHLSLFLSNPREVATQWDALAASTQLTHLHCDGMAWDPGMCVSEQSEQRAAIPRQCMQLVMW